LALVAVAAVAVPAWLLLVRGATPSDAGAGEVPQSAARAVQDSEPAAPVRDSQAATPPRDTEPASRPSEPAIRSAAPPRAAARQAPAAVAVVGWLTIDSDPFGMVQIDGVDVRDTPLIRHQLSPGSYTVRVAREGYQPWSASITITAGNTVSRRITLVPAQ
jgi:hypothetical protein